MVFVFLFISHELVGRLQVRMVTGDSIVTAKAIAEECGILTTNGRVIEGREFRTLEKEQLDLLLPNLDVRRI